MDDIYAIILSKLNLQSLLTMRNVSRWYDDRISNKKLNKQFPYAIRMDQFENFKQINNGKGIKNIGYGYRYTGNYDENTNLFFLPNLTKLEIFIPPNNILLHMHHKIDITDELISQLTQLTDLIFTCDGITNNGLKTLTNLKTLGIHQNDKITNDILTNFPKLTKLELFCNNITDEGLSKLTNLKFLSIFDDYSNNFTDLSIKKLTALTDLYIKNTNFITTESVRFLTRLKKLSMFQMNEITNEALRELSNLELLYLGYCKKITDEGLTLLTNLTGLNLDGMHDITIKGVNTLSKLTGLCTLYDLNDHISDHSNLNKEIKLFCSSCVHRLGTYDSYDHFDSDTNYYNSLNNCGCAQ